jgi:hypothetical protein
LLRVPVLTVMPVAEETRTFTFDYSYWSHDEFEEEDDGALAGVVETCCAARWRLGYYRSRRHMTGADYRW